jgi:predicted NUDIX family NTP pyrophosphohydrolase
MSKKSAGILLYRMRNKFLEVFLVHPGGPFWAKKDGGAWSIPKGEFTDGEDPLKAAIREFKEETGIAIDGDFLELNPVKQKSGKLVYAWAVEGDIDSKKIKSNDFEMEWPPRSGKMKEFPEIDKADWFSINEAGLKVNTGQLPLLNELASRIQL